MSYILYGSAPSPFVRRMRMAMEHIPYEFKSLNIYDTPGALELNKVNPLNQIPCLLDNGQPIWDSRVMLQYLGKKHGWPELSVTDENRMTAIQGMMDAGVGLFLMKKSEISLDAMYPQRLKDRIVSVMNWLAPWMASPEAGEWNHVTLTLYAGLDWMKFRELHSLASSPAAEAYLARHAHRPIVQATDPRKG
jgi:glutathione S-transferase